jgi:hypothetical protein
VKKPTVLIPVCMATGMFLTLPILCLFDLYRRKGWDGMMQAIRYFLETTF